MNIIRKYKILQIEKNEKLESVIVETREFPHLEFIIRNNILKLGHGWSHTIICGKNNYNFMTNMCQQISSGIKIIKLDIENISISEYSKLLSSHEFWNMLVGEKILVYQEDSIIFKDSIENFLKFDYIGAPWKNLQFNKESVGNGGLSLRSKDTMNLLISIIQNEKTDLSKLPKKEAEIIKNHCIEKGYENGLIPEDVYFGLNLYKLELGNLPTKNDAELFSTESILNLDSFGGHNFWLSDNEWKNRIYDNCIKQFNCKLFPSHFIEHRGGWSSIINRLIDEDFHNIKSKIDFYDILEEKFLWDQNYTCENNWIGILHSTPKIPTYINKTNKNEYKGYLGINGFFENKNFIRALDKCKLIFVLSDYVKDYLVEKLKEFNKDVKVFSLKHPVVGDGIKEFNYLQYTDNNDKKIVFIGQQLRKIHSFYQIDINFHKKMWLTGTKNINRLRDFFNEELKFYNLSYIFEDANPTYLSNFEDYDEILSKNIVFLDLYDASANNTVLECIIRNTPIIIKKLPAVVEYLGEGYPLYFENISELPNLINHNSIIEAHNYLKDMDKYNISIDYFINEINRIVYKEVY